jgi:hypothetical protein
MLEFCDHRLKYIYSLQDEKNLLVSQDNILGQHKRLWHFENLSYVLPKNTIHGHVLPWVIDLHSFKL